MWEALKEMSDRKAARAGSNGTCPFKCRVCGKPGHTKVDCPWKKKVKKAAGSVQQLKKGKAHAAESSAGAKEDVPFDTPELSGPPAGMGPKHYKSPPHLHHPPPLNHQPPHGHQHGPPVVPVPKSEFDDNRRCDGDGTYA
ncbi:conserved hypothetical protein [Culex quinquefasciatus]|uniref:CCHC-type domain-containing protein n=1 Tax=Culex quinquefasciatus TaxID=7176 RepID=B0W6N1_CULQU|nr:conserved hypothetical protein [Culex quinquefasciatus]|eukprot:XP_001844365.1 conserved hypothetical protein [Culex quinquefasciatus]